jgi:hypothetical protein
MFLKHAHNSRRALDAEDGRRMIERGAHGDACRVIRIPRLVASGADHNGGIGQVVASFAGLRLFGIHGAMVAQKRKWRMPGLGPQAPSGKCSSVSTAVSC